MEHDTTPVMQSNIVFVLNVAWLGLNWDSCLVANHHRRLYDVCLAALPAVGNEFSMGAQRTEVTELSTWKQFQKKAMNTGKGLKSMKLRMCGNSRERILKSQHSLKALLDLLAYQYQYLTTCNPKRLEARESGYQTDNLPASGINSLIFIFRKCYKIKGQNTTFH